MTETELTLCSESKQFLTFVLANEEYAVDILRVQEIRGWMPVTRIPGAPGYMKGVLNLRGEIIPIIDLRERFGFETKAYNHTTVVVFVWIKSEERQRSMGLVVDAVADTYDIANEAINPAPLMGEGLDPKFIEALATVEGKMVILLDIDYLLNADALACTQTGYLNE
ncbi:chemotaxis protein CheW [Neptunomonas qingdaonensis]|uniref:Chemotaxis protein CheW n=1 Tax=Neptunomonas qingdaonensis TaxID=1045558 RepID=A0A1I2U7G0_9GAMM|nr:chemotaxis protein CheW [Neptunomonas qingdaonensis]SFG73018.1 purine-binding chemotaxis protein CheW [Neptunomonas qingdaonensis]